MIDEKIFMDFYIENVSEDIQEAKEEYLKFSGQLKEFIDCYVRKNKCTDRKSDFLRLAYIYANIWSNFSMCTMLNAGENVNNIAVGVVTTSVSNDILAIISLASDGLDYQAMNILRNLYELGLLLINICIDEEKRVNYIKSAKKGNSYSVWRKYFNTKSMIETIKSYSNNDKIFKELKSFYPELSSFVHNSFMNVYVFSYSKPAKKDDNYNLNFGAHYVTRCESILEETVGIIWIFTRIFRHIMQDSKFEKLMTQLFIDDEMGLYKDACNGSYFADYYYLRIRNIR